MPITFKFICKDENDKMYQIYHENYSGSFTLNDLHSKFACLNISKYDIMANVIFFVQNNDTNVKIEENDIINVFDSENKIVYLHTKNNDIKNVLFMFFRKMGEEIKNNQHKSSSNPNKETIPINKPLQENKVESLVDTNEITALNKKSIEILSDPDFVTALKIFHKKPHIYNSLAQYVQSGNVHSNLLSNKTINDLTVDELNNYKQLALSIKDLGFTEDVIINALIVYNGRLNLAVRAIITNGFVNS
jgi:hypothetical protein